MLCEVPIYKIVELAVRLEDVGEAFYSRIAATVTDPTVKKLCQHFAEQEREHRQAFQNIAALAKKAKTVRHFNIDPIALINTSIEKFKSTGFQSPTFDFSRMDLDQCLEIALDIEMETVTLYEELRREMDTNYDEALYNIIREENTHVETITNVLNKRDPRKHQAARAVRVVVPETIEIRRRKIVPSVQDYWYVIVIFLFFMVLIVAMIGPRNISYVVNSLMETTGQ